MLDIAELDESLKLRSLGRLMTTKHPFLRLLRDKLDLNNFFAPKISTVIEGVSRKGVELLKKDRLRLFEDLSLINNVRFLSTIRDLKITEIMSNLGRNSLTYFLLRRRGRMKVRDLNQGELRDIIRFIEPNRRTMVERAVSFRNCPPNVNQELNHCIYVNSSFKRLELCTSKEIRGARDTRSRVSTWKSGLALSHRESATYCYRISKLTSTQNKTYLLRALHGDIYTKERQLRFGLSLDDSCPRCGNSETLMHKLIECEYVKRIWRYAATRLGFLWDNEKLKKALGAHEECAFSRLPVHCEIIKRILLLKEDATYLIHPKNFVEQCIASVKKLERKDRIKKDLENLLRTGP